MRGYRILVLALTAVGAAVAVPTAANADYAPPAVTAPTTAVAGQPVQFSGTGFKPISPVSISVTYGSSNSTAAYHVADSGQVVLAGLAVPRAVVNTVTTDAAGSFATPVNLTQAGTATITGSGVDPTGAAKSVSTTVVVAAAAAPAANGGSQLAVTGQDGRLLGTQVAVGVGAVLLGAAMVWLTIVWRRRSVQGI